MDSKVKEKYSLPSQPSPPRVKRGRLFIAESSRVKALPSCHLFLFLLLVFAAVAARAGAQSPDANPYFARRNTFSVFTAYSNDSSHILLGYTENRRLLDFGVGYNRRLFMNRIVNWQYSGELLPVALESDPVIYQVLTYTAPPIFAGQTFNAVIIPVSGCQAGSGTVNEQNVIVYNYINSCGRRWTMGEAMSPVGLQWNFLPRRKTQGFVTAHGGYMFSTQPIPTVNAGSFNFTFDLGVGIEMFRTKSQSMRAEYRYHHISNHDTAQENPGIDNGLFQVTWSFGR
jgi:opacity protein-like surface antigen